jgi:predicted nucleic acid-binding Zn ribbon protein
MTRRENDSNKIKDLIPKMLSENHLQKGMDQISVKEAWLQVMGPGVANYTEEVSLKNQVLLVKLNSSALRQELEYGKDKILKMMRESLTHMELKKIRLL